MTRPVPLTPPIAVAVEDLDDRIGALKAALAAALQEKAERDRAAFKLAILEMLDDWFEASELHALVPLSPRLSAHLADKSVKSVGRVLRAIVDVQDRSAPMPALRLLRLERSTGGALWKIEIAPSSCEMIDRG